MDIRHTALAAILGLALAACGTATDTDPADTAETAGDTGMEASEAAAPAGETSEEAAHGSLEWAMAGDWRSDDDRARDTARNPAETLAFLEVDPADKVVELWPGGGWYTRILAPYLAVGGGQLVAAGWDPAAFEAERRTRIEERNTAFQEAFSDQDLYGDIEFTVFSANSPALTEPGSADVVLTFRNLHNWMSGGYADKFYEDAFEALKPGGILGVVEHRLPSTMEQDPTASSGYVHEDFVKAAAERAGFEFVASSEINANPADTADHPFGVWTLPPVSRTSDRDGNTPEGFDAAAYEAIGESDRMTLKFRKPE
mgnify:CR=1 FL=1